MAKYRVETGLNVEGRQVMQPSAPDISQAGKAYEGVGKAISAGFKTVGQYVAAQKKAALELESSFNSLTAQREMSMNLMKFKQRANVNENDLAEFNKTNQSIGAEILKNTSEENRAAVTKSLMKYATKAELSAFGHVAESKNTQMKQSAALTLYEGAQQLEEYAQSGDIENFDATLAQLDKTQGALIEAGLLSPAEYKKSRDELLQVGINGKLAHDYTQAIEQGGERAGGQFIENFWNSDIELTHEQKSSALKSLLELYNQDKAASNQVGQAGFRDAMEFATQKEGGPKNEEELNAFIDASAERGFPLNEFQAYKVGQAFRKKKSTVDKRADSNIAISKMVATGDINGLLNESSTAIDNNYIDTKKFIAEQTISEANEAGTDAQRIMASRPDWMIGATIAAQTPVPISQWQREIHSKLLSTNEEDILSAVSAYNYVENLNKRGVEGVQSKDKAFIQAITNDLERTNLTPQEVIEKYRDSILNVDERVKENRQTAYKEIVKNNANIGQKIAKKAFGENIGNTLKQPSAELYAAAQDAFEREYQLTGDQDQAIDNAVSYLKDNGGESMFAPKNEPVWNPPENLPYFDFGNVARNQATKYLKQAVVDGMKNADKLPYSLEWSSKMPEFPDKISEDELFNNKYDKGEWWLKIDGEDHRVYFISPNYNQANSFAETRYQVMYEKDGYLHNLLTINPRLSSTGEVEYGAATAMMTFQAPLEMTPNLINRMQSESAQNAKDKYQDKQLEKQFPRERPVDIQEGADLSKYLYRDIAGEKVEEVKAKKQAKQILEEKNKDLPKKIEKEKLRRQQEIAKKVIEERGGGE